jgi:altronate hydrolase
MDLIGIQAAPGEENAAILLNERDNVAIARLSLPEGQRVRIGPNTLTLRAPVPGGHKLALQRINSGEAVRRYGEIIGRASQPIEPGDHVHTHNLFYEDPSVDYDFPAADCPLPAPPESQPTFLGYWREDGRVGTRNYIAVVAASNCAAHTAEMIAASYAGASLGPHVDGIVAFPHGEGCGHSFGPDVDQLRRTLGGVLNHPNVGAAIILGLGCEVNQVEHYLGGENPAPDRLLGLTVQGSGGTRATVEAARRNIDEQIARLNRLERRPAPASKLVLGLQCGGSDSFSGITSNPALGHCCDLLGRLGGSAVLAETPEIIGAEHLLVRRARSRGVAENLLAIIAKYQKYLNQFGGSFDDNPSPGNKEGGLSNILEKSLGAVAKGGTGTLNQVLDYAGRVEAPGLVFMNSPGYDPVSLAGIAAGGANVIAFTTGRGSANGFPTVPVIKITSNSATYRRMRDNMDLNAGRIAEGEVSVEAMGLEIFDFLLRVASGEPTASERNGHREFVPWRIGPVL